ncbi:MAG: hypothetical protein V7646_1934, partial [Pseudonocardia sp.]
TASNRPSAPDKPDTTHPNNIDLAQPPRHGPGRCDSASLTATAGARVWTTTTEVVINIERMGSELQDTLVELADLASQAKQLH